MKYLPLIWAALRRKPARSILTLLSIVVAFLLVGVMSGVSAHFAQLVEQARVDRVIVFPRFGDRMPVAYVDQIAALPGVAHVAPEAGLGGFYQDPKKGFGISMTDERILNVAPEEITPEQYNLLNGTRDGVILNTVAAARFGWKVGDRFPLQTVIPKTDGSKVWTFEILAIVPPIKDRPDMGIAIGNYAYLDEARATDSKGLINGVRLLVDDPKRTSEISNLIETHFVNSSVPVTAMPETLAYTNGLQSFLDINFITYSVSAAALFMILFLTGNVMAQSVRERIPEFAVMKTIGFSDTGIFALVLVEALVPYLIGASLGLALTEASPILARRALNIGGVLTPLITPAVIASSIGLALVVAVIGSLPAAWRMSQLKVVDALVER